MAMPSGIAQQRRHHPSFPSDLAPSQLPRVARLPAVGRRYEHRPQATQEPYFRMVLLSRASPGGPMSWHSQRLAKWWLLERWLLTCGSVGVVQSSSCPCPIAAAAGLQGPARCYITGPVRCLRSALRAGFYANDATPVFGQPIACNPTNLRPHGEDGS